MEEFVNLDTLHSTWIALQQWAIDKFLVYDNILQFVTLTASFAFAFIASRIVRSKVDKVLSRVPFFARHTIFQTLIDDLLLPTIWLILLGLIIVVKQQVELANGLIIIAANLIIAWLVIRISSSIVENRWLAKTIAIVAWTIAALNIVGLLDPIMGFLDGFAFSMGEMRVSMLTVLKAVMQLALFLWIALALSRLVERRISKTENFTPSVQVLLAKLMRIFLITFAILVALSSVGIDITALAIFSGAIGVGIGFGLQKIFSNLISGLILLLDRSIKPGDVIEVDETYGWINKLSARHVSVITRDGKEHLIPNEDLITQKVINWSYSSKSVRLRIGLGISYDSDVRKAIELCHEASKETDRILEYPKPNCLMTGFGDNSIDMELRVWIEDPSNGVGNVKSILLINIWDKFQEHGISVPFPQRDVHIDKELLEALKK